MFDASASVGGKLDIEVSGAYHRVSMKPTGVYEVSGERGEVRPLSRMQNQRCWEGLRKFARILMTHVPLVAILLLPGALTLQAQDDHKRKLPVLDKITTTNGQEAFSGSIQAVDFKGSLLQVHSTADNTDEYFPLKKTVHVANAAGERVALDNLKPGISVLVYYEQKGDHRAVKEIVVLGKAEAPKAKSSPPS